MGDSAPQPVWDYELRLAETDAATGYFGAEPQDRPDFDAACSRLRQRPNDTWLRRYLLGMLASFPLPRVSDLLCRPAMGDPVMQSLLAEAIGLTQRFKTLRRDLDNGTALRLAAHTPLPYLRAGPGLDLPAWREMFAANAQQHAPLLPPDQIDAPLPPIPADLPQRRGCPELPGSAAATGRPPAAVAPETTFQTALAALRRLDLLEGVEMRHVASLSPIALLHKWRLALDCDCRRHRHGLAGIQTAYGRGLTLDAARAAWAMETVERVSAFASVRHMALHGYRSEHLLERGSRHALASRGLAVLDPNALAIDAPYDRQPLHWIEGHQATADGARPVWVPFQAVGLFSNLDEIDLFTGLGSTGLAAGNTIAQARLNALLEILERDTESTSFFLPGGCFRLAARTEPLAGLLLDYRRRGIDPVFQDLTGRDGVPCYKCFVTAPDGRIAKGTAANLDGRRAVVAALTETPYPYPQGPASRPFPMRCPVRFFEDLPCLASGDTKRDLEWVEALLRAGGFGPIYVDLTRSDLALPVVRALVPGLESGIDFGPRGRLSPRLLANYLRYWSFRHPSPSAAPG